MTIDPAAAFEAPTPAWADASWEELRYEMAALNAVRPDALAGQVTGALLRGWPIPPRFDRSSLTVTVPRGRRLRRAGVTEIQSARYSPQEQWGVRLNSSQFILLELGRVLSVDELVRVIDTICGQWRGAPIATVGDVRGLIAASPGIRGLRTLEQAAEKARDGVASPAETDLRLSIVRAGLPEPLVNAPVRVPDESGLVFRPDLSYPRERIAIEYEGDHHRLEARQWERDIERERLFRAGGWEYLRVTKRTNMHHFLRDLATALTERGTDSTRT